MSHKDNWNFFCVQDTVLSTSGANPLVLGIALCQGKYMRHSVLNLGSVQVAKYLCSGKSCRNIFRKEGFSL